MHDENWLCAKTSNRCTFRCAPRLLAFVSGGCNFLHNAWRELIVCKTSNNRKFSEHSAIRGKSKTKKEKKMRQTSSGFCLSLHLSTKSGALKIFPERKKPKPIVLSLIEELSRNRQFPIKESPQESQLSSSIAAIVKGSPLPCQGISAC